MGLSKNAVFLLKQRYCRRGENIDNLFDRVSSAIGGKHKKRLKDAMLNGYFLPASPVIRNAGMPKSMLHPCYVLPLTDSIQGIMSCLSKTATIFHYGGGVGFNASKLRPKGAPLTTGGTSSGVVSFLRLFDELTDVVKQGGFRRGALMSILDYNHPEILSFITSKLAGSLTNFNISVLANDEFMKKATMNNKDNIDLVFKNEKYEIVKANDIFDQIVSSAYICGDPGLLFYDRINEDNPEYPRKKIVATNPCITGDTTIDTPYGKIPIKLLVGKTIPVYCYGSKITISTMRNIRKTCCNADIVKVFIDNGKYIKTTPDHKFMLRDGTYKEASKLNYGDSLMPLYRYKRNSKGYNELSLNDGSQIGEAQLVAEWKYGRKLHQYGIKECVHHIDENKTNNSPENLIIKNHSSDRMMGDNRKYPDRNPKVVRVEKCGKEDVYNGTVDNYHNYATGIGIIIKNCGELPLFSNSCCNLGSINLSNLVTKRGNFNFSSYRDYLELGMNALKQVNRVSWYPYKSVAENMANYDFCGLGHMGLADALIKMGIYYDSKEALSFLDTLKEPYVEITNMIGGSSFYKRSQAPTGSLSIIADCSSGIEPVFSRNFERHLTVGVIPEVRAIYKSKYCKTAHEISPVNHLKIQAKVQSFTDGAVSKTINLSHDATLDDIRKIYIRAWKSKLKGVTVFRDRSKEGVLQKVKCDGDSCYL